MSGPLTPTGPLSQPDFVGMYRWHLPDPVMYASDLKVTLQQIGAVLFPPGHEAEMAAIEESGRLAGDGWQRIGGGDVHLRHRGAGGRRLRHGVRLLP